MHSDVVSLYWMLLQCLPVTLSVLCYRFYNLASASRTCNTLTTHFTICTTRFLTSHSHIHTLSVDTSQYSVTHIPLLCFNLAGSTCITAEQMPDCLLFLPLLHPPISLPHPSSSLPPSLSLQCHPFPGCEALTNLSRRPAAVSSVTHRL